VELAADFGSVAGEIERQIGRTSRKIAGNILEGEMSSHQLRIALVSTPRSGNTWFRRLMATAFMIDELAVHNPKDLDWKQLPDRFVLQCHWHRVDSFTSVLAEHKFRVVVLTRHPLDVLISILHFAPHEAQTARWLEGEGGNEMSIFGAQPRSSAFLEYATGPRAAALLSVSHEWRQAEGNYSLRYEDVVRDPAGELKRLGEALNHPATPEAIAAAIASNSIERLRAGCRNQHYWQGRPGLWKALLPADEARRIARVHTVVFEGGGYECDPNESLDAGRADANWLQLEVEMSQRATRETQEQLETSQRALGETQAQLETSQRELGVIREQLETLRQALGESHAQLETSREALSEARAQVSATAARLGSFEDLGPTALGIAQQLRSSAMRHPRVSSALKRIILGKRSRLEQRLGHDMAAHNPIPAPRYPG
jgi:Sulfotransferase domain